MALNASGPISLAGSTTGQSIAVELGLGATTQISLNQAAVRTLAGIATGAIIMPTNFWGKSNAANRKAIFGYGYNVGVNSTTNLVSDLGIVDASVTGVGTARMYLAAAGYGADKAIFGFGSTTGAAAGSVGMTNLVSNTGVVALDTTAVGQLRMFLAAAGYGGDKAIFGFGSSGPSYYGMTNLVSNTGVVALDTTAVGITRASLAAASYSTDKAIFGYGTRSTGNSLITNLVSNTGVVAADVTSAAVARYALAAAAWGT